MAALLVSCGAPKASPDEVTDAALHALQTMDPNELDQYWNRSEPSPISKKVKDQLQKPESQKTLAFLSKNLTYQILSSQEDGDSAQVTATITNINMAEVLSVFLQDSIETALHASLAGEPPPTYEGFSQQYRNRLIEILEQGEFEPKTTTVEIHLALIDREWVIQPDEPLLNALTGGLLTTAEQLS